MFLLLFVLTLLADELCLAAELNDPFEAYLVTSGPGEGMYTRVGHSAIWVSGGGRKEVFFNWGAYDSSQENFLWKFFMGTANYKLTLMTEKRNTKRIKKHDQMLKAQHLNLSPQMKRQLQAILTDNARPENRVYTYHWEEQNCATMIRDILDRTTNGGYQFLKSQQTPYTPRHEVLRHLGSLRWAWFGWGFMASSYAEQPYTKWDILHIPERLMEATEEIEIEWEDGSKHQLVDKECILNTGSHGWAPTSPPTRWPAMYFLGFVFAATFAFGLHTRRRSLRCLASLVLVLFALFSGGLGSFFMFCWQMSSLEGYGPNENWFYANPLTLLLIPYAITCTLKTEDWKKKTSWVPTLLALLALLGILLNPFGSQVNAEFIGLLGLPLLFIPAHFSFQKLKMHD